MASHRRSTAARVLTAAGDLDKLAGVLGRRLPDGADAAAKKQREEDEAAKKAALTALTARASAAARASPPDGPRVSECLAALAQVRKKGDGLAAAAALWVGGSTSLQLQFHGGVPLQPASCHRVDWWRTAAVLRISLTLEVTVQIQLHANTAVAVAANSTVGRPA